MLILSGLLAIGIILSAIGYGMDYISGSSTGVALAKAGSILTFVVVLALCAYAAMLVMHLKSYLHNERIALFAAIATLPFMIIVTAYGIASAFHHRNIAPFSIWVTAFVAVLEEFITVAILLVAGFLIKTKLAADEEHVMVIEHNGALAEHNASVEMAGGAAAVRVI